MRDLISGDEYLDSIVSDEYDTHDIIHVDGEEEFYIKSSYARKAVELERKYQKNKIFLQDERK